MSFRLIQNITRTGILAVVVLLVLPLAAQIDPALATGENTSEVIEFLIGRIENSHLIFIRNGEKHSSEEAAKHIRRKYRHFKSQIETPEDFIRLCASKSLVSGKPYLVVTHQGTVTLESWLGRILRNP
ncbi:MAG: hypothetical protein C4576_07440 [Desulfobacteraceae bacterium]|nr:MAG: hypothetical protein C4576_07440 [Desulfobacteraceae bacterium]